MGASTLYSPQNLHTIIFNWLNETFPHRDNRLINGAQGGVGSGYFAWCFSESARSRGCRLMEDEHIPPETDLVLVELGINDLVDMDGFGEYERLIRGVLEMESRPAIINVEWVLTSDRGFRLSDRTFSTLFPTLLTSSALHQDVLAFYDVPSISLRDVLLPRILSSPDTELPRWFRTGGDISEDDPKIKTVGNQLVDLMHVSRVQLTRSVV